MLPKDIFFSEIINHKQMLIVIMCLTSTIFQDLRIRIFSGWIKRLDGPWFPVRGRPRRRDLGTELPRQSSTSRFHCGVNKCLEERIALSELTVIGDKQTCTHTDGRTVKVDFALCLKMSK